MKETGYLEDLRKYLSGARDEEGCICRRSKSSLVTSPVWFDGTNINETAFCENFSYT